MWEPELPPLKKNASFILEFFIKENFNVKKHPFGISVHHYHTFYSLPLSLISSIYQIEQQKIWYPMRQN